MMYGEKSKKEKEEGREKKRSDKCFYAERIKPPASFQQMKEKKHCRCINFDIYMST